MVDGIIRWALSNRLLVLAIAVALMAWGGLETARTPVDVFPDLTAPTVTLVADAHGMAPEEVEALLTLPIETAMNGATGVRRVRSKTQVGIAVIDVDFDWGTDIFRARQVVSERLQLVTATLPPDVEPPVMGPVASIMGEILYIGLTSKNHSPMELRTTGEWQIARRVLAIPGVAQAIVMGGDIRQFQVLLDPRRLDAWEITADEVAQTLRKANENTSAGFLVEGGQEQLIQGLGRIQTVEDIAATLVTMRDDRPVLVGDLGDVQIGPGLKRGEAGVDGERGVVIGVRKQPRANTVALTGEIKSVLDTLKRSLPEGMELHDSVFRQADFIEVAVDNVSSALLHGALLVIVTVLLFLMSGRATIITALAIPLSLLTAMLAMRLQGFEINTMTLGGMAIAVGALVDDAIIDVENVVRRLRLEGMRPKSERRSVLKVVFEASKEVRRSIVFATLVIIVVFTPLFFLTGVEGRLLRPLGFAYSASLAASLPRRAARCGARPCLTTRPRATNRGCVCAGRPQACGQPGRPPRAFGEAVRRRCPAGRRAGGSPPPTETPGARLGGLSVRSLWAGGQQAAELRRASRGVEGSGGQGRRVRREQPAVHCPVPAGHPPPLS